GAIEQRMPAPIHVSLFERVEHAAIGFLRELTDEVAARPLAAAIVHFADTRCLRLGWVDATRKQRFEPRVDARTAETLSHQCEERKCRQVAFIKHDRV